jgi:hypothetical protein
VKDIFEIIFSNKWFIALIPMIIASLAANIVVERLTTAPDRRRDDAKKRLYQNILEKWKAGASLSVNDVLDIGRGLDITRSDAIDVIYMLLAEAKEQKEIDMARHLIDDVNKKAPYEDLPDDVKPSIIRLSEICDEARLESDKSLLIPIQRALSHYKTMLAEHQSIKTQSRVSYVVGIISVLVGIIGLALAFRGPTTADVRQSITDALRASQQQVLQGAKEKPSPSLNR